MAAVGIILWTSYVERAPEAWISFCRKVETMHLRADIWVDGAYFGIGIVH